MQQNPVGRRTVFAPESNPLRLKQLGWGILLHSPPLLLGVKAAFLDCPWRDFTSCPTCNQSSIHAQPSSSLAADLVLKSQLYSVQTPALASILPLSYSTSVSLWDTESRKAHAAPIATDRPTISGERQPHQQIQRTCGSPIRFYEWHKSVVNYSFEAGTNWMQLWLQALTYNAKFYLQ